MSPSDEDQLHPEAEADPVALALFAARTQAICDEMGLLLRRTAFSPNIKDRLDFSCALFDAGGVLFAQAAHIPVHLGSMAFAMGGLVARLDWQAGDVVMFNDPYLGGTHLPDVTVVEPVFVGDALIAFAATRAHHADVGATEPGSMPLSRSLEEEGVVIPPLHLLRDGAVTEEGRRCLVELLGGPLGAGLDDPDAWRAEPGLADFHAQRSAVRAGAARVAELCLAATDAVDPQRSFAAWTRALGAYAGRLAGAALAELPRGRWQARDLLDDDGTGAGDPVPIVAAIEPDDDGVLVDFTGTAPQVPGNLNCPLSVTAAAVYYVFRCLMPAHTPGAGGAFEAIRIVAPEGCLVNARRPAAVAAGNVETSMRIVDVLFAALAPALPDRVAAASQGTMNNIAMGARGRDGVWDYYETVAGGCGGGPTGPGAAALHSHMTNTLNTPVESLERHYPLRVERYGLRRGSGGAGRHGGGDGVERAYRFLSPARCTLLTERRRMGPPGLGGGSAGRAGTQHLNGKPLAGKVAFDAKVGDLLELATPGGGGWGEARPAITAGAGGAGDEDDS